MNARIAPLAVTTGDPAGIGPDLVLALPAALPDTPLVVLGDRELLAERARTLAPRLHLHEWEPGQPLPDTGLAVWHRDSGAPVTAGQPDPTTGASTLALLRRAADGCMDGTFSAMVTAPLAKSVIREGADTGFTGHTEYLAQRAGVEQVVMMLAAGELRVALATTHLPLREVADAITPERLTRTLEILHEDLRSRFCRAQPSILVLGLNPHAGESGHLGREEIECITPVLERLRSRGMDLHGPVPADTAFTPEGLEGMDAVLAMYHDQGLPVLKYAGFGNAVNITLGLPFIRTSVDHGTAWPLAGTGRARPDSLIAATRLAQQLATGAVG